MAIGKKTGGRDIKPGEARNPYGRPKVPSEVKEARKFNSATVSLILESLSEKTTKELISIARDPESNGFEAMIASIIAHGTKKGDSARANFFLDRTIGKSAERIEHSGPDGSPIMLDRPLRELPPQELLSQLPIAIDVVKKIDS